MTKRPSIVRVVKAFTCLLVPILLSFSGIGDGVFTKKRLASKGAEDSLRIIITGDLYWIEG